MRRQAIFVAALRRAFAFAEFSGIRGVMIFWRCALLLWGVAIGDGFTRTAAEANDGSGCPSCITSIRGDDGMTAAVIRCHHCRHRLKQCLAMTCVINDSNDGDDREKKLNARVTATPSPRHPWRHPPPSPC